MNLKRAGVILSFVLAFKASAATLYVAPNNASPAAPYTNWLSAATNMNDAIDAASAGDVILVTNGVYGTGERSVDSTVTRVAITKPVSVQSVNARGATISGSNAVRCVYLASGASLCGFVLIDGSTREKGGGIHCESVSALVSNCSIAWCASDGGGGGVWSGTLYDCSLEHNWSYTDHVGSGARESILINCSVRAHQYGGVYSCFLTNCMVADNSNHGAELCTLDSCAITNNKSFQGGGVTDCTLYNCLLAGNSASGQTAGGAIFSTLNRCVVKGNSAPQYGGGAAYSTLNDCQLVGNSAGTYGGGAYNCTVSNCALSGNSASWGGGGAQGSTLTSCTLFGNTAAVSGGGAAASTLYNCLVVSNSAGSYGGGGTRYSTLNNCTVVGNSAPKGGGALDSEFYNSIVYYNTASSETNYGGTGLRYYSCVVPAPTNGFGNITVPPGFVNAAGDWRLQSESPCINAGNNLFVTNNTDLDRNLRIAGGTVDIGAYEFPSPCSVLSFAWAQQYGVPTDGLADYSDLDADGLNNWQEWRCQTDPMDSTSALRILSSVPDGTNVVVTWQSVAGLPYFLECAPELSDDRFTPLAADIIGQDGTTMFTATNGAGSTRAFFRVGVR